MDLDQEISEVIGKVIRMHRNFQGLSQEELAFRSGINHSHLGRIERGTTEPQASTLLKINYGLGYSEKSVLYKDIDKETAQYIEEAKMKRDSE